MGLLKVNNENSGREGKSVVLCFPLFIILLYAVANEQGIC